MHGYFVHSLVYHYLWDGKYIREAWEIYSWGDIFVELGKYIHGEGEIVIAWEIGSWMGLNEFSR
jgi:hypothetical protein